MENIDYGPAGNLSYGQLQCLYDISKKEGHIDAIIQAYNMGYVDATKDNGEQDEKTGGNTMKNELAAIQTAVENARQIFRAIRQARLANDSVFTTLEALTKERIDGVTPFVEHAITEASDYSELSAYALKESEELLDSVLDELRGC